MKKPSHKLGAISPNPEDGPWLVVMLAHSAAHGDAVGRTGANGLSIGDDLSGESSLFQFIECRETSLQRLESSRFGKMCGNGIQGFHRVKEGGAQE